ncbi:MAG: hypothetical protein NTX58_13820 [Actinobacteria bacterium]|jgi:MFS family permease|nr:hypothetical protein [Actinomycetota bacterium]
MRGLLVAICVAELLGVLGIAALDAVRPQIVPDSSSPIPGRVVAILIMFAAIALPILLVLIDWSCDPYERGRPLPFTISAAIMLLAAIGIAIAGSWDLGALVFFNAWFVGTTALFIREQQS